MVLRSLVIAGIFAALAHTAGGQDIRVRLFEDASPRQISLSSEGGDVLLYAGDFEDPLMPLQPGEEAIVSRASNQLHVKLGEMKLYAKALRVEPQDGARVSVAVREGSSLPDARTYPGRLLVTPNEQGWELRLVNRVGLEEYVAGVVASEYGLDDLEGSKAMAVVARTYALAALREDPSSDLSDHTLSQVYHGSARITDVARQAARETEGEVLTHDGSLIQAVYFSSSGGRTANNEDVWDSGALPYLRGKSDPYDDGSPHTRWSARLARTELLQSLGRAEQARVEGFVVGDRSPDGRVSTVELLLEDGARREISANAFRLAVIGEFGPRSLRSTRFDVRREGDVYVFEGRGYGHGVGMSQWGAHEMATRGHTYRDILRFYYTDVEIASADDAARPEPAKIEEPTLVTQPEPVRSTATSTRIGW